MSSARHSNRGQRSDRGRSRGGRSRDSYNPRVNFDTDSPAVPTISQVVPGAPVSIVLKADQPTGRQVQGVVGELLTRGNHPRGIKVRLQDGRVGRVQKMASEEAARAGSEGLSGLGRNGEMGSPGLSSSTSAVRTSSSSHYQDFRVDALDEPQRAELSLEDYVVVKGNRKKNRRREGETADASASAPTAGLEVIEGVAPRSGELGLNEGTTSTCPVCGDFEGDEIATSHHVNSHFE